MTDFAPNFSCSDPGLSRDNITVLAWTLVSEGPSHDHSIIAIAAFLILFILLGIPWNTIVLLSILKKRLYKEPTYILLLNLVIADLLVCVCVMPFNIASAIAREFNIGNSDYARCQACHTCVVIIITLVYISLFTLAVMSVDRLIYIKWPLHYTKIVSVKTVLVVLVVVWAFSLLLSLPPVFGFGEIKFANTLSTCSLFVAGRNHVGPNILYMFLMVCIAVFPFMTTLVANIWLLIIVCKSVHAGHKKNMGLTKSPFKSDIEQKNSEDKFKAKYQKQQFRLAQVFGAIFAVNIITWLPTIFIALVSGIVGAENVPVSLYTIQYLAFLSQPAIHPMLETCLVGKARSVVMKCLQCCKEKNSAYTRSTQLTSRISSTSSATALT